MKSEPERITVRLTDSEEQELRRHDTYHGRRVLSFHISADPRTGDVEAKLALAPIQQPVPPAPPPKQAKRFEHIVRKLTISLTIFTSSLKRKCKNEQALPYLR